MPVSQSPFALLAAESLAAWGVGIRLTASQLPNTAGSHAIYGLLRTCCVLAAIAGTMTLTGCGSPEFDANRAAEISTASANAPKISGNRKETNPAALESTIRDAYPDLNALTERVRRADTESPQQTSPATTLVAMQASEDDEVPAEPVETADESATESDEPDDADQPSDADQPEAETSGKFDGEFDPSEIDTSQDEIVEPSASDWRNAELVPTPLPRKEIVAEEVPTPLGIPENPRVVRKPPITPRTRADVTSVVPGGPSPIAGSPVVASPKTADADANESPRIAASPVESVRPSSDALMSNDSNADGTNQAPETVQHGTQILDQAVAAAETAALPGTGLGGPVDFTKWPTPEVAIFVTGQQHGYIEPCGCTGLEHQKGGVARRMTFATQLRDQGWELLPVDAGNLIRRFGRQAEIKFHRSLEALRKMGYVAVGFGPDDVRIGVGDLIQEAAAEKPEDAIYASANVVLLDPSLMPAYRIVERSTMKIAVTSILDPESLESTLNEEIILGDPVESSKTVIADIKAESPDYTVLTFYGTEEAAQKLVREVPGFDLVVVAGGYGEPTYQPEAIEGSKTKMILTGNKGMYVGLVGLYKDAEMRYARVPLDDSFGDAPAMRQLMAEYQFQLRDLGLDNLGLKPIPHPSGEKFVGSETCGECHTTAFEIWEDSPHFGATESLVHPGERGDVPRHFDPECISCHVTGWNAQNYYPYESGYLDLDAHTHLHGNGCENCHGPGESHAAAENGEIEVTDEQRAQLRAAMQLPLEKAREKCMECHDLDNSPDFHEEGAFDDYWAEVEHYGVD